MEAELDQSPEDSSEKKKPKKQETTRPPAVNNFAGIKSGFFNSPPTNKADPSKGRLSSLKTLQK